jgi:acyl-coenzyme A thioesterase PaaI-like protein
MNDAQRLGLVKAKLGDHVPFAIHTGLVYPEVGLGGATVTLPDSPATLDHIGSQHGGALFTVGETASGAAFAGAFLEQLSSLQPVVSEATIRYTAIARGSISARAALPARRTTSLGNSSEMVEHDS